MAGVTGLEPAASGVTGRRSNQLSYYPFRGEEAETRMRAFEVKRCFSTFCAPLSVENTCVPVAHSDAASECHALAAISEPLSQVVLCCDTNNCRKVSLQRKQ